MRRAGFGLIFAALILAAIRCFTGIVYRADEPVAALVVKHRPGWAIERTETPLRPVAADTVLDEDEPQLAYGSAYLGAMRAAPALVLALAVGAAFLLVRSKRRS